MIPSHSRSRHGMSLIEIMAALIIAATVAVVSIQYLVPADQTSKYRSCELSRKLIRIEANRYYETTGQPVSADLRQLRSDDYLGNSLPTCPVSGESYRLAPDMTVICPTH